MSLALALRKAGVISKEVLDNHLNSIPVRSNCCHMFYDLGDFTGAEIDRRNLLYLAVVRDRRSICKRCGEEV